MVELERSKEQQATELQLLRETVANLEEIDYEVRGWLLSAQGAALLTVVTAIGASSATAVFCFSLNRALRLWRRS